MHLKSVTLTILVISLTSLAPWSICAADMAGKHLFILSGQSNMAKLKETTTFIPTLEKSFGKGNILVVKDAQGGQSIKRWYKKHPYKGKTESGDLYDRLMGKVNDALHSANADPRDLVSITFLWMQGEQDARSKMQKYIDVYEPALLGLLDQLRNDFGRADINFVIGRLSDFGIRNQKGWENWTRIREVQMKVADGNPKGAWVNTDDLNDGEYKGKQQENGLHYTVKGYDLLGTRLAEKAIELVRKSR